MTAVRTKTEAAKKIASNRRQPPATFVERHRGLIRLLVGLICAAMIFLAGMGTSTWMITNRMKDIRSAVLGGGALGGGGHRQGDQPKAGPSAPPTQGPDSGQGSGGGGGKLSDEEWAAKQGLPAGLPPQALQMLRQNYPNGVPDDIRQKIKEELGGQ